MNSHQFILIALLFTILYISLYYVSICNVKSYVPKENYVPTNVMPTLETGDLIFLSRDSFADNWIKFHTNSLFNHCGFIIVHNHVSYLLEADIGQGKTKGVRLIKLIEKLDMYSKKKGYGMILKYRGPKIPNEYIAEIVQENMGKGLNTDYFGWLMGTNPGNKVFCSELISNILMKLNIIKNINSKNYSPGKLFSEINSLTNNGIYYDYIPIDYPGNEEFY